MGEPVEVAARRAAWDLRRLAHPSCAAHRIGDAATHLGSIAGVIDRLRDANAALAAELRKLEWSPFFRDGGAPFGECPACMGCRPEDGGAGHHPDCTLAAALAGAGA